MLVIAAESWRGTVVPWGIRRHQEGSPSHGGERKNIADRFHNGFPVGNGSYLFRKEEETSLHAKGNVVREKGIVLLRSTEGKRRGPGPLLLLPTGHCEKMLEKERKRVLSTSRRKRDIRQ